RPTLNRRVPCHRIIAVSLDVRVIPVNTILPLGATGTRRTTDTHLSRVVTGEDTGPRQRIGANEPSPVVGRVVRSGPPQPIQLPVGRVRDGKTRGAGLP